MRAFALGLLAIVATLLASGGAQAEPQSPGGPDDLVRATGAKSACNPISDEAQLAACSAAIDRSKDDGARALLLFSRAFAYNQIQQYQNALADLDQALKLRPNFPEALHERGYTRNSLADYAGAEADIDREIALVPPRAAMFQERAMARFYQGDLKGAYDDRAKVTDLSVASSSVLLVRADAALWLGRFTDARADVAAALKLADAADNKDDRNAAKGMERTIQLWTAKSGAPPAATCGDALKKAELSGPDLIGDCTAAFLSAPNDRTRADMLTVRANAWLVGQQDRDNYALDLMLAAAFNPQDDGAHANLGHAFLTVRHSWAARQEFDKALAIKSSWYALAGRGAAKFNLGDLKGAFEDSKASVEERPNEEALTVLGDISMAKFKDPKAAKDYWMGAYHLGDRDDGLISRLKDIGVAEPDKEPK